MRAARPIRLLGLAAGLLGCLADPAPIDCETGRDCPHDAPWCLDGACALHPAGPDAGLRPSDGAGYPPALAACRQPTPARCAPVCDWLVDCARTACPRAVDGMPGLLAEVTESCEAQCAVDGFVGDQLCAFAYIDGCSAAIADIRDLLGFGLCR